LGLPRITPWRPTGHKALNGTARDRDAFAIKLPPDLARALVSNAAART
jgi:hypothetical protein